MKHIVFCIILMITITGTVYAGDGAWGSGDVNANDIVINSVDSTKVPTGGLSVSDIANGANGFVAKTDADDSTAAGIARDATKLNVTAYDDSLGNPHTTVDISIRKVTAGSGASINLDGDDLTNGQYSGLIDSVTAGENLVAGDLVYMFSTGKMFKAQADSESSVQADGVALGTINADAMGLCLRYGYLKLDAWTTVQTLGADVFVDDDTSGLATTTSPPDAGDSVYKIGKCFGTDLLFFDPTGIYVVR